MEQCYWVDKAVKKVHNVIAKSNGLQQWLIAVVIRSVLFLFLPTYIVPKQFVVPYCLGIDWFKVQSGELDSDGRLWPGQASLQATETQQCDQAGKAKNLAVRLQEPFCLRQAFLWRMQIQACRFA